MALTASGRAGKVLAHAGTIAGRRDHGEAAGVTPPTARNRACEPRLAGSSQGLPGGSPCSLAQPSPTRARCRCGSSISMSFVGDAAGEFRAGRLPPTAFQTPGSNHRIDVRYRKGPGGLLIVPGSAYGLARSGDFSSRPRTIEGKTQLKSAQRVCALRLAERRQLNFGLEPPDRRVNALR